MAIVGVVALGSYWSRTNAENAAGDALAATIVIFLARLLFRDGRRVWARAKNNDSERN